jgi:hypothetical protein
MRLVCCACVVLCDHSCHVNANGNPSGEMKAYEMWLDNQNDFFPMRRTIELEIQGQEEEAIDVLKRKVMSMYA